METRFSVITPKKDGEFFQVFCPHCRRVNCFGFAMVQIDQESRAFLLGESRIDRHCRELLIAPVLFENKRAATSHVRFISAIIDRKKGNADFLHLLPREAYLDL